ncbi:hypothetical protein NKG95_24030 [Mesorhizobium sp. M1423]|uniref:hypothetical protein n=1 Tax=Mesorhizobium sp. M1423 TaxID=2957101 RepID=UPI00333C6199
MTGKRQKLHPSFECRQSMTLDGYPFGGHWCGGNETPKSAPPATPDPRGPSIAGNAIDWAEVQRKIALIGEARMLFGVRAARQMWADLGLPSPATARRGSSSGGVKEFLREATEPDMFVEVSFSQLYERYKEWAGHQGCPPASASAFGKRMAKESITVRRRSNGATIYCGLRMRGDR